MIRIVLADDHAIVRDGVKLVLGAEPDFDVIGEADDGPAALELVRQVAPDVLLLDIMMPTMSGIEVAEQLRASADPTRIVILSMQTGESYFLDALRLNVDGYVLKSESAGTLVQAIRGVMNGRRFLSPALTERTIDAYLKANNRDPYAYTEFCRLTPRERDVMQMIVEGHTNTSVASHLSISQRTVETHRSNIMHKLQLTCQADLVRFAVKCGLLQ